MLTILISWIVMSYVLYLLGDMLILVYNTVCRAKESYNVLDIFVLGTGFITLLLSFSSLWLPTNQYVLLALLFIVTIYLLWQRRRIFHNLKKIYEKFSSLSLTERVFVFVVLLTIMTYIVLVKNHYDATFYHYQNIRWNEEYSVIPGLANLEDRFGFNSNYFLLSALFSFRFLLGDAITTFQSLLFVFIIVYTLYKVFSTRYNIWYVLLFIFLLLIFFTADHLFADSSTDIVPLVCVFYYFIKFAFEPEWYKKQPLMACLLPVSMVTFKLSTIILCLAPLAIIIYLIRQRKIRKTIFILSICIAIICLWCIRNVIVSGYLVYPLFYIDLFSFDWKVPAAVATLQSLHINLWAKYVFNMEYIYPIFGGGDITNKFMYAKALIPVGTLILTFISCFVILCNWIFGKKANRNLYLAYTLGIICIAGGMMLAPDFRFSYGYILGCLFIALRILFPSEQSEAIKFRIRKTAVIAPIICFVLFTGWKNLAYTRNYAVQLNSKNLISILLKPWNPRPPIDFTEYKMGCTTIFLTKKEGAPAFDKIPASSIGGLPSDSYSGGKAQSVETLECRGNSIQDGFRTKAKYMNVLNNNIEKYKIDFYDNHEKKCLNFLKK